MKHSCGEVTDLVAEIEVCMNAPESRGEPRFETTQWSLVMTAAHRSTPEGQAAFATLCERYWYPLYAYVRRRESDLHHAQDLTQGFFTKVMEKNYIADADPNRGRFRTFLLSSLRNYLANEWDKGQTQRRGGRRKHFSLQFDDAERRYRCEPAEQLDAETMYQRRWAIELLARVLQQLQQEYGESRLPVFDVLKQYLTPEPWPPYREVAEQLGMSEGAVKVAVSR